MFYLQNNYQMKAHYDGQRLLSQILLFEIVFLNFYKINIEMVFFK
jgi:hypothetical protein